jgi:hypothetical protein
VEPLYVASVAAIVVIFLLFTFGALPPIAYSTLCVWTLMMHFWSYSAFLAAPCIRQAGVSMIELNCLSPLGLVASNQICLYHLQAFESLATGLVQS